MKTGILILVYCGLAGVFNLIVNNVSPPAAAVTELQENEKFAGSTPGGNFVKKFLSIAADESIEVIRWDISLESTRAFTVLCSYGNMQQGSQNFIGGGAQKTVTGKWIEEKGSKSDPAATVYRLTSQEGTSIDLVRLDENILHILFHDGSLLIGDGGQSYTLNKTQKL